MEGVQWALEDVGRALIQLLLGRVLIVEDVRSVGYSRLRGSGMVLSRSEVELRR